MRVVETHSEIACTLGEGAFWHPERQSFFWVDILGQRLMERDSPIANDWAFDRPVSAMGWIDRDRMLLATARDLITLDLASGREDRLCPLEADNDATRSNDGRADPQGGFWIGTMGFEAETGAGAIYRFFRGEIHTLFEGLSIPNAICFAPGGRTAYFTDTPTRIVRRVALDAEGWPDGPPEEWLDLRDDALNPDGAVIDADGRMWLAQWGASRVACYGEDARLLETIDIPATQVSCPAFGGPALGTLFATTAAVGAPESDRFAGMTFRVETGARGQAEHRVIL